MRKLEEFQTLYNFLPQYSYAQLRQILSETYHHESLVLQDSSLYEAIETLTGKANPSQENSYDTRWFDFFVPLQRRGYVIAVQMGVVLLDGKFFLSFSGSDVEVQKGKESSEFFLTLILQTLEFAAIVKRYPEIVMEAIPYDIRTGRVLGKYVMEDLLPLKVKEELLKLYGDHLKAGRQMDDCCLEEYLNTAALCYRAAFGSKTEGLTSAQMYGRWADGRDCGMMRIKDRKSKRDFGRWITTEAGCGGHPFEIVFSMNRHGIHLLPPSQDNPYFRLRVTDYAYAMLFLEMVKALIQNRVPFKAHNLEGVLEYLCGESYFAVNAYAEHNIDYDSSYRNILKHIEWDEPEILKWK